MARLRFTLGTRYLTCGDIYLVRHILADARVVVENQTSGGQDTVALSDLIATWAAGALIFEVRDPHPPSHETSSRPIAPTVADLQGVEPAHRDEAWRRYTLIQPLLTLPSVERTRQALETYAASVRAEDDASVSRASLQRWLRAFTEGGHDIRALVSAASRSGGRGQSRLTAETEAIVRAVLAACAAAPHYRTGFDVYLLVLNRVAEANRDRPPATRLTPPSPRTIYRRIAHVGEPTILRRIGRVERQATRPVGSGPAPTRVLERVEIDHTPLDVILVDPQDRRPIGRPTLTLALDVHSGFPLGCYVGFEPPSYRTVQSCLLHAILPKEDVRARYGTQHPWLAYGLPETLVVDNGPEFVGRDLDDACGQLGIVIERTPVRQPWYKGSIERHFRTHNTGLVHTLPGTTASVGGDDPSGQAKHMTISSACFYA
jgi:putative transposase